MKYESFKPLPDQLADKYKKMFINKHIYYESNPSLTEEELDKIVFDFIKLYDIFWHGLPDQIAKLITEKFGALQPEPFPEDNSGKEILYGYPEGVFNGKGEKTMSWGEFEKKYEGHPPLTMCIESEVHKTLILDGIRIGNRDCVYLNDFLLVVTEHLNKMGLSVCQISKEEIIKDLCVKWKKDSKEVHEILSNIKLFQDLTGNLSGSHGKSITVQVNKSDVLVKENSKDSKIVIEKA